MKKTESDLHTLGNKDLLVLHKVAFLCSRACPEDVVLRALCWADRQCARGGCIISGFSSPVEKELFHHLAGRHPIIVALAQGIRRPPEPHLARLVAEGRLLVLTRYAESVTHACEEKCLQRNRLLMQLADEIVIGHAVSGGSLERLCREFAALKEIAYL